MIEMQRRGFLKGLAVALGASVVAVPELVSEEVVNVEVEPKPEHERPRLRGTVFGPLSEEQAIKCLVEMAGKREYPRILIYPQTKAGMMRKIPKGKESALEWFVEMLP